MTRVAMNLSRKVWNVTFILLVMLLVSSCAQNISVADKFNFEQVDWGSKDLANNYNRDIFLRINCDSVDTGSRRGYPILLLGHLSVDGRKQGEIYCNTWGSTFPKHALPEIGKSEPLLVSEDSGASPTGMSWYDLLLTSFPSSRTTRIEMCITGLLEYRDSGSSSRVQEYTVTAACKEYMLPPYEGKEIGESCYYNDESEYYGPFDISRNSRIHDNCNPPGVCETEGYREEGTCR